VRLELRATIAGEQYDVTTSLRDVIEWERKYRKQASTLGTSVAMEDLAFLAWSAGKREKLAPFATGTLDAFIDKLEALEVVNATPANPTG
jgi:triphosphoribosyl-dephospho-CoA synthetase